MSRRCSVVTAVLVIALSAPSPVAAWQRVLSPLYDETGYLLDPQIDSNGHVVVAATFAGSYAQDFVITSLAAADGAMRWRRQSTGDGTTNFLLGMAMDRRGDIVVVGFTNGANDSCETCRARQTIWKLDGGNGSVIWAADAVEGTARAVAIDAANDVFVARLNESGGSVAKLSGTDGAVRWQADVAFAHRWSLAVDGAGNVAVGADLSLTLLAGLDGHVIWHRDAAGEIERLVVMSNGDPVAIERTYDLPWGERHVVRRHGATGEELWRKRYVMSWYLDSIAFALGPGGALFTSGGYFGNERPDPFGRGLFVAGLDPATGTEQWRHDLASEWGDGSLSTLGADEHGDAIVQWWDGESRAHLSKVRGDGSGEAWRRDVDWFGGLFRLQPSPTGVLVLVRGDERIIVDTRSASTGSLLPCGNGRVDAGEECDDGNAVNGDGCDANCTISRCGNGEVGCAEECDDGNGDGGDGCSAGCVAERPCGSVDLRGNWEFALRCDFGFFGSFEYHQEVALTQDCEASTVTVHELTGCDIRFGPLPTAGFTCETSPIPLVGSIDGLRVRTPADGTIHTTLTSPVTIPLTAACSFSRVTADMVLSGRIYQRYPWRAGSVVGSVVGTYQLGGPGSESCSSTALLPCDFQLSPVDTPPVAPDAAERAAYAAAESRILVAQHECVGRVQRGCTQTRTHVTRWIDRARRLIESATHDVSARRDRAVRRLGRASRALRVAEVVAERGGRAQHDPSYCTADLDPGVRSLHQRLDALRRDLVHDGTSPAANPGG